MQYVTSNSLVFRHFFLLNKMGLSKNLKQVDKRTFGSVFNCAKLLYLGIFQDSCVVI